MITMEIMIDEIIEEE
ncbi:BnaAnng11900D [Brassica napus]|uniref:BnaAnng11900D protein n=2 Tax=Brassica TaxID=3705 RepID=A0A078IT68_BRANA|nr:BnaAnng11900D [Brassica napus]